MHQPTNSTLPQSTLDWAIQISSQIQIFGQFCGHLPVF